jgi:uracil phosphoribosyltransferase
MNYIKRAFSVKPAMLMGSMIGTGLVANMVSNQMSSFKLAECQGGRDFTKYGDRVVNLNHIGVVKHLLSMLRDRETDTATFRHYSDRIMRLLIEEALSQELEGRHHERRISPTGDSYVHFCPGNSENFAAVSIMRGGDSMVEEVFKMLPNVSIGKVLIQRDESTADKRPVFYYSKLPDNIENKQRVFVLDPMCATGGSAAMCIRKLIESGVKEERITFINLVCSEEGIDKVMKDHPKLKVITACVDQSMNEQRYILPGLGDFGDRYFGSKLPVVPKRQ